MFKASQNLKPISLDFGLFILRVAAGGLMLLYGAPKLLNFSSRWHTFSDPLGIGSEISFILCVFAEFFCAVFLIVGAFSRMVTIPLIINMLVIAFIVHGGEPMKKRDLSIFFLAAYTTLFITGPGKYSLDGIRR